MFVPNKNFQILTPDGIFHDFDGIKISKHFKKLHLSFSNGSELDCSENHLLKLLDGNFLEAQYIDEQHLLYGNVTIIKKELIFENIELYDPINVGTKHEYVANDIVHHNCEFQGSVGTLISGYTLKALTYRDPKTIPGIEGLSIHHDPSTGHKYIIIVDTSRGKGLD
jgi:hypothetical protein